MVVSPSQSGWEQPAKSACPHTERKLPRGHCHHGSGNSTHSLVQKEKVCVEGPHPRPQGPSPLWSASGSFSEASSVTPPSPPGSWSFPDKHVHSFALVLEVGAPALCQDCTYLQCLQVVEPQPGRGTASAGWSGELLHLVGSRGAVGVWSEGSSV